jgi:hypothetical protein
MKKSRFTEEQIAYALRRVEAGTPAGEVCAASYGTVKSAVRELGCSRLRELGCSSTHAVGTMLVSERRAAGHQQCRSGRAE